VVIREFENLESVTIRHRLAFVSLGMRVSPLLKLLTNIVFVTEKPSSVRFLFRAMAFSTQRRVHSWRRRNHRSNAAYSDLRTALLSVHFHNRRFTLSLPGSCCFDGCEGNQLLGGGLGLVDTLLLLEHELTNESQRVFRLDDSSFFQGYHESLHNVLLKVIAFWQLVILHLF